MDGEEVAFVLSDKFLLSDDGSGTDLSARSMTSQSNLAGVWAPVTSLSIESGLGSWVTTTDGKRYLDFTSGIAVTSTGHCHPLVVAAVREQAGRLIHGQVNCYRHDRLEPLARRLTEIAPKGIDSFFFANSGSEITEAAVKLAKVSTGRPNIVTFAGSFHGRTHLAMAMTSSKTSYRSGYPNLVPGIFVAPFPSVHAPNEADEVERCLTGLKHLLATQSAPGDTAAVVVEPVIGEGGYFPAPAAFLRGLRQICDEHGILLVADEVQTGFGRTGSMFCVEQAGVVPDVLMMAKGIASGFPMSALGASAKLMSRWPVGSHGGTYGGNPIACAAALATIDILSSEGFLSNVCERGEQMRAGFRAVAPEAVQVRGLGLMNAVEFESAEIANVVVKHCREHSQVLAMSAGTRGEVVRWMPPLTTSEAEISLAIDALAAAVKSTR